MLYSREKSCRLPTYRSARKVSNFMSNQRIARALESTPKVARHHGMARSVAKQPRRKLRAQSGSVSSTDTCSPTHLSCTFDIDLLG